MNHSSKDEIKFTVKVPAELDNKRLDYALSKLAPNYSRSLLQHWIKIGYVKSSGEAATQQNRKVTTGQTIVVDALVAIQEDAQPQNIALDIIYEDQDIIIINKPVGLVVHPGAGCKDGTLLNALLHYASELAQLPRAGIVHRLDKDTSGLLVIARNLSAHKKLVDALQAREIKREYQAIVWGKLIAGGTINAAIGRHQTKRTLMAVVENNDMENSNNKRGKEAVTHYRVITRFTHHTHIKVILETGRTHQIRVHLAHTGYPIVGDQVYGGRMQCIESTAAELQQLLRGFKRQALHAAKLTLLHPNNNKLIAVEAPLPQDMQQLLKLLKAS